MTRRRSKRLTQSIAYVLSAIVALSMIISLIGPILLTEPVLPTPTWPPTWTPLPTFTATPASGPEPTLTLLPMVIEPPTRVATTTTTLTPSQTLAWTPTSISPALTATPSVSATMPVAGPSKPLVFAVCGDNRDSDAVYRRLLDRVVQDGNAFLINTGDLAENGSRERFEAFQALMADFPLPFYPVPGNHDRDEGGSLANFVEFSGAPAAHYSFDAETVHFTMVNSASGHLREGELAWIDQDLAATEQPVKIVIIHHPPFDPDGTDSILLSGSEALMSLMQKHSVAYVFAGNIHAYGQEERDGTVYVITGGAGARLYSEDHPNAFYHYVQVVVEGTQVSTRVVRIE